MYNSGKEKSRVAHVQVEHVLDAWKSQIVRENLLASRVPANVAKPFELEPHDVAEQQPAAGADVVEDSAVRAVYLGADGGVLSGGRFVRRRKGARHAGDAAFEPGAADRDRVGQAADGDDVQHGDGAAESGQPGFHGPLHHVAAADRCRPATSAKGLDLPPLASALWLVAALVPMSALFSALCLACAAFARSTKEGQYYLMPLLLVSMPLMMLPMAPGAELNLGNSLIPVTGVVLLLMALVQGNYAEALRYVVPVCGVTLDLLPLGDSLGRVSVQPGVGAVPRERAARSAAVAGAPGARSAGYAVAGGGVLLRGADFRDPVLHAVGDVGQRAGDAGLSISWRCCCSSARSCASRCRRC